MKTFLPLQRAAAFRKTPWGYYAAAEDSLTLIPNVDQLSILEEGLKLADEGVSFDRVAEYVTQKSGKPISDATVRKYYMEDETRVEARDRRALLMGNYTVGALKRKKLTKEQKIVRDLKAKARQAKKLEQELEDVRAKKAAKNAEAVEVETRIETVPAQPLPEILPANENVIRPNPGPQTDFLAASEREILFGGQAGGGKQVSLDTPIPTIYGVKSMRDICVGDFVFRDTGEPVEVIWKSGVDYTPDAYEVEFDTGEIIKCDSRHLWKTLTDKDREYNIKCTSEWRARRRFNRPSRSKPSQAGILKSELLIQRNKERLSECVPVSPSVKTTQELFNTRMKRAYRSNHSVVVAQPAQCSEQELPVPPYLFGAWLGDGYSMSSCIGMSETDIRELEPYFAWEIINRRVETSGRKTPFCIYTFRGLVTVLKEMLVYDNKHIPYVYLRASVDQRKELLRGLMDTDGTVDKQGKCSIMFMNKALVEDTLELICSLGIKASITTKIAKIKDKSYGTAYRVCFNPTFPVFKLSRKLARQKFASRPTNFLRYVTSVRKCDPVPMQCIQVNHADGMYCVGRTFIPTHNSHAITIDPLRTAHMTAHRAITFRRTNDEMRELIAMSKEIFPKAIPGSRWQDQKSTWTFPNGGSHWFRYLDRDDDVTSMQGQAFTWIGFDEVTQWASPFVFNYMRSRLRTTDPEIKPYLSVRCTSNPGNVGHSWVKKLFVDPAPPNTAFPARDLDTGEVLAFPKGHSREGQPLFYRRFIPSRLSDNPYLASDGEYEANLLSLPEVQRKQLLEGNWDIVEGSAFSEFRRDLHVVVPFEIPWHWKRFRAADWGYTEPHAVIWFAEDDYGRLIVYRELYSRLVNSADLADRVLAAETGENIVYGVLDSSCWHVRDNTPSTADVMRSRGCFWRPAPRSPGSRVSRKQELHRRLQLKLYKDKDTGKEFTSPGILFFNSCVNTIRTLPVLPLDKTNPEDVDTDAEDHAYDALTYGLASRPMHRTNVVVNRPVSPVLQRSYNAFGFPM